MSNSQQMHLAKSQSHFLLQLLLAFLIIACQPPPCAPSSAALQEPTVRPELVEALLSESLRLHQVQACQGERVNLHCPRHTHISPLNSFFGRLAPSRELCPAGGVSAGEEDTSCDFAEAHARVQEQCRAKRKCRLFARPEFFGERDPCPTTGKYLQIGYKCTPVSFEDQNFCEGQQTRLGCKSGQRLSIYSAHYGRTVNGQAMQCGQRDSRQQVQEDCVLDVLPQIARNCHAQPWCSFPVDDRFLGTPCPYGVSKYLSIIYVCVAEEVFSEAALRGKLESMEALGKELDELRKNISHTVQKTTAQAWERHPLLGDNWEEDDDDEGMSNEANKDFGVDEEKKAESVTEKVEAVTETTVQAAEWPWAFLIDRREEALPWLLLTLLLLFLLMLLSLCLLWQCRARANEKRERRLAEAKMAKSKLMTGGHSSQTSPAYMESDGSSQRLLDPYPPQINQYHQNLQAMLADDIYHGCYAPAGSAGTGSSGGGCGSAYGGSAGAGSTYYAAAHFTDAMLGMDGFGPVQQQQQLRRLPASLHCYS